jgi:hypothetical protein
VRLNPAPFADLYALLYLHKRPNEATISNRAPIEIDRLHNLHVFTECYIDNCCIADFWLCHEGLG